MTEEQAIAKLKDKIWRLSHLYKIQTKDARMVTFKPNLVQQAFLSSLALRNIILKARQMGMTTFCCINMLDDTITTPNTTSAIIAHTRDDAAKIFEITKRAYNNMPDQLKPRATYDNRNELYFEGLDSKIYVDTDLRGGTTHNLHISEVAFIEKAESRMAGILETVPVGGKITLESTANGVGGYFYDEWQEPKSEFKKHFFNWLWDEQYQEILEEPIEELVNEYRQLAVKYGLIADARERFLMTDEQFYFYIKKVRRQRHLVQQEYPLTPLEAFISSGRNVFHLQDLQKHITTNPIDRKWTDVMIWEQPMAGMRYVIGCDVAEGLGGDYSVIEVFNADTGEQAAEYISNRIPPAELANYLKNLGHYYNNAFIVIEVNNHGRATVDNIKSRYYNLYRRQTFDKVTNENTQAIGWRTDQRTKALLVDNLEEAVREQTIHIRSKRIIDEMSVFVQTEEPGFKGFGAQTGHDDTVIATGLALQGIKNLPRAKRPLSIAQKKLKEYKEKNKDIQQISSHYRPNQRMKRYGVKN